MRQQQKPEFEPLPDISNTARPNTVIVLKYDIKKSFKKPNTKSLKKHFDVSVIYYNFYFIIASN